MAVGTKAVPQSPMASSLPPYGSCARPDHSRRDDRLRGVRVPRYGAGIPDTSLHSDPTKVCRSRLATIHAQSPVEAAEAVSTAHGDESGTVYAVQLLDRSERPQAVWVGSRR